MARFPGREIRLLSPRNKTVLLDTSPPALKSLRIGGTLAFDEQDLELKSDWIMVHGKLQAGMEAALLQSRATITLTGSDETENVMNMGAKVLGVMGETLDLHGKESREGWTRLDANAAKGSSEITLETSPSWPPVTASWSPRPTTAPSTPKRPRAPTASASRS